MEPILQEWETFARSFGAVTAAMDSADLRDHAKLMLQAIAADLETPQSPAQQEAKATGDAPARPAYLPVSAATSHGALRADDGFTLDQMIAEYRALRASVLRLWAKEEIASGAPAATPDTYQQQIRFNEAIDEALADSMHTFAHAVDQMFAAKARRRMEAMGTLAAGLGHDMVNVLMPMRLSLDRLKKQALTTDVASELDEFTSSVAFLEGLTKGLRSLTINPDVESLTPDSTTLCEWWETAKAPCTWALSRGMHLHVDGLSGQDPALPPVRIPSHALMQAVYNLVQNAAQALAQRNRDSPASHGAAPTGNIWISAAAAPPAPGAVQGAVSAVRLTVRDDGPGMDEHTVLRCTDAFFTTKSKNMGSGLGLYVVRTGVERYGGKLVVESKVGKGTVFTLILPAAAAEVPIVTTLGSAAAPERSR